MNRDRSKGNEKKKHHFIPKVYLRQFVNETGHLRVYLKDRPHDTIWSKPDQTAFRNYYYSQPKAGGGQDNNSIENFFGEHETKWNEFIKSVRSSRFTEIDLSFLYEFMTMQAVRTPAIRDTVELMLSDLVLVEAKRLQRMGELPPPPKGYEDILNHAEVSIDPHQSIHAMMSLAHGFAQILETVGLCVVRNDTGTPFITSDNPIVWFDPTMPEDAVKPHSWTPGGQILLFYPLAPDLLLLGTNGARKDFSEIGLFEGENANVEQVNRINRALARFAYQAFYCSTDHHKDSLIEFAADSPTLRMQTICTAKGIGTSFSREFGPRRITRKWKPSS